MSKRYTSTPVQFLLSTLSTSPGYTAPEYPVQSPGAKLTCLKNGLPSSPGWYKNFFSKFINTSFAFLILYQKLSRLHHLHHFIRSPSCASSADKAALSVSNLIAAVCRSCIALCKESRAAMAADGAGAGSEFLILSR